MAPEMPTGSPAGPPIVLTAPTAPGEAEPVAAEIVTGRELRLVPSPMHGAGVLFERVVADGYPAVANHLEDLYPTPIIAAGPLIKY